MQLKQWVTFRFAPQQISGVRSCLLPLNKTRLNVAATNNQNTPTSADELQLNQTMKYAFPRGPWERDQNMIRRAQAS